MLHTACQGCSGRTFFLYILTRAKKIGKRAQFDCVPKSTVKFGNSVGVSVKAREKRLRNDLFCVEWDVKRYSISISIGESTSGNDIP